MTDRQQTGGGVVHPGRQGIWRYVSWTAVALVVLLVAAQWPLYRSMAMELFDIAPPDDGIGWRSDLEAAQAEAARAGKPLLVNFTADWCGPCVAMKRDVWPRGDVAEKVLAGYVPVRLDVDTAEGRRWGSLYNVQAIPTTIVTDAEGEELERVNYLSRGAMEQWLSAPHPPDR